MGYHVCNLCGHLTHLAAIMPITCSHRWDFCKTHTVFFYEVLISWQSKENSRYGWVVSLDSVLLLYSACKSNFDWLIKGQLMIQNEFFIGRTLDGRWCTVLILLILKVFCYMLYCLTYPSHQCRSILSFIQQLLWYKFEYSLSDVTLVDDKGVPCIKTSSELTTKRIPYILAYKSCFWE